MDCYRTTVISIEKVRYVAPYQMAFKFSDGTERTVDFGPFLRNAKNPMTSKYLDLERFKDFSIEHGDIVWNDYELCFPIWDLYEGKV